MDGPSEGLHKNKQTSIEVYDDSSPITNNQLIRNSQTTRSARIRQFKFYQYKPVQQIKNNNNVKPRLPNLYDITPPSPEPSTVLVPRPDILQGKIPLVTEQSEELLDLDNQIVELEKRIDDLNKRSSATADSEGENNNLDEKFKLVNKKNDLIRRQMQLNILEQEKCLEKANEDLKKELRTLMSVDDSRKTKAQLERQQYLHNQLVALVNKRNELVLLLDHQEMEIEADKAIRAELETVIKRQQSGRDSKRSIRSSFGKSASDQNCSII